MATKVIIPNDDEFMYDIYIYTGNGLGDNGRMVMRVIARVEIMMVKCSVKPVVEKLHWTHMK